MWIHGQKNICDITLIWSYSIIFFCDGLETEIWYTVEYDDASAYQKYSECMAQIYTPGKYRFVNYPFWPDLPIYNASQDNL